MDLDLVGGVDGRCHHPEAVLSDRLLFPLPMGPLGLPGHSVLQPRPVLLRGLERLKQRQDASVTGTRSQDGDSGL